MVVIAAIWRGEMTRRVVASSLYGGLGRLQRDYLAGYKNDLSTSIDGLAWC